MRDRFFLVFSIILLLASEDSWSLQSEIRFLKSSDSHLIFDNQLKFKEVALTFAGNAKPQILASCLKQLAIEKIFGHFFMNGQSAFRNPELVFNLLKSGHVLGSQGLEKKLSSESFNLSQEAINQELKIGHEMNYVIAGSIFPFIRLSPRHGGVATREFLANNNMFTFYWNIDYYAEKPLESIIRNLKRENYRGIVSLSLSNSLTIKILKILIDELKKEDVKVILFYPPKDTNWQNSPPLIDKYLQESISSKGTYLDWFLKQHTSI